VAVVRRGLERTGFRMEHPSVDLGGKMELAGDAELLQHVEGGATQS
jgi:hypothetical protein